jgi:hypothetical protein
MPAVGRSLYQILRGGGAVIEGAEFLLTHRQLVGRYLTQVIAAAACTFAALELAARLEPLLAPAPVIALPWYFILAEWVLANLPAVASVEIAAWIALGAYFGLAWPRRFVWAIMALRGVAPMAARYGRERTLSWFVLSGAGWTALTYLPGIGLAAAVASAGPVLGVSLALPILALRGWPTSATSAFLRSHGTLLTGLGFGLAVSLAVPAVNLVALPCAIAGTVCLLIREPLPVLKTSAETIPYVSPDTTRSPRSTPGHPPESA